ncbi:hypothetical protein PTHTG4_01490 [Parageobacillus thermoglucosidasius]|uniref:O-antigen ligase family protein n=1 Tax=Parageobacillus thermoglucosidasius TaxID=1426 RepID=UPI000F6279E2|nr:O-antigen ligase family protein [Parageobacillus thermoglucosidasius]GCD81087.1 hypothetical protein PTHTG4_01490 [Parageobacillus thermoglucosidasius]
MEFVKIVFFLWGIIIISADLKVTIYPYIHWIAFFIMIFPIIVCKLLTKKIVLNIPYYCIACFFLITIICNGWVSSNPETMIQYVKLFFIFLTTLFFLGEYRYSLYVWQGFVFAVILNFVLLFLGVYFNFNTAYLLTSDGRWGTLLNYPGSLVKVGLVSLLFFSFTAILLKGWNKIIAITFIIMSIFIITYDGSRTGLLLCGVLFLILSISLLFEKKYIRYFQIKLFFTLNIISLGTIILIPKILQFSTSRLGKLFTNLNAKGFIDGLRASDPTRFEMLIAAVENIKRHPIIGNGVFETTYLVDGKPMVVHNTYLQIWGDFGVLSTISYIALTFFWLFLIPKRTRLVVKQENIKYKALYYNSIFLLIYFNINGLFHPISTEFSEWILFIIPFSIVYNIKKIMDEEDRQLL